jgi:hypothetical protein
MAVGALILLLVMVVPVSLILAALLADLAVILWAIGRGIVHRAQAALVAHARPAQVALATHRGPPPRIG